MSLPPCRDWTPAADHINRLGFWQRPQDPRDNTRSSSIQAQAQSCGSLTSGFQYSAFWPLYRPCCPCRCHTATVHPHYSVVALPTSLRIHHRAPSAKKITGTSIAVLKLVQFLPISPWYVKGFGSARACEGRPSVDRADAGFSR
jgi:hypothetical protein